MCIPVLNGGILFRENLKHIKHIAHLFDKIIVSITSPDEFPYDKESCIRSNIKNLELIEFNEKSLVKNFLHIFKHISNSYIFVLGHDDTPIEQGIIVIKQMILESHTHPVSSFGSNIWVNPENNEHIHTRLLDQTIYQSKNKFVERRTTDEFKLNQSGMIFHSSEVNSVKNLLSTNLNSYWFDMMLITTPGVQIIYESPSPVSKVGTHPEQLSINIPNFNEYVYSGLWYHLAQACYTNSFSLCKILLEYYIKLSSYIDSKLSAKYTFKLLYLSIFKWEKTKIYKYYIYANIVILFFAIRKCIPIRFMYKF